MSVLQRLRGIRRPARVRSARRAVTDEEMGDMRHAVSDRDKVLSMQRHDGWRVYIGALEKKYLGVMNRMADPLTPDEQIAKERPALIAMQVLRATLEKIVTDGNAAARELETIEGNQHG